MGNGCKGLANALAETKNLDTPNTAASFLHAFL